MLPSVKFESLSALALVGLGLSPIAGSALALVFDVPRRAAQVIVLTASVALWLYGRHHYWRTPRFAQPFWQFPVVLPFSAGLVLVTLIPGLISGHKASLSAWLVSLATIAWLTVSMREVLRHRVNTVGDSVHIQRQAATVLMATTIALAITAYLAGRDPGEVHMAFRASTTIAGVNSAIVAATGMTALSGWPRAAVVLPATYLNFLATSRVGLLLFLFLSSAVVVARSVCAPTRDERRRTLAKDAAFLAACVLIVVLPARFMLFYPYATSRPGDAGAQIISPDKARTEWEALVFRYGRLLRVARGPVFTSDTPSEEIRSLEREGAGDSRWLIYAESLRAIKVRPWGYWPLPFDETTRVYCGNPEFCEYPHNLFLEIGYHFGWIPLGIVVAGLAAAGLRALRSLTHPAPAVRVSSLVFLGYLAFAQVSGNLLEHTLLLGFALIWSVEQDAQSSQVE